jgi:putative hemolysin
VFRLGDRPIRSMMTPRPEIVWLDTDAPVSETQQEILDSPYSRFPVAQENIDHCLGVVSAKDFLAARLSGSVDLRSLLQPALFLPENRPALDVLEQFRQSGQHMALITDEYGGIGGLVTLNDLTEAIVGSLPNQDDEPQIIRRDDGSWLLDGLLSTDELKDVLKREALPLEASGNYHTLGGLVITFFGRVPQSGDYFETEGLRFEVMDMDGNRVDKVLVTPVQPETIADEEGSET